MTDWLRNIRLGVVDILGVTVPGMLLILFTAGGFFLPLSCFLISYAQGVSGSDLCLSWDRVGLFWQSNKIPILLLILILAYILGYILRLVSPNKLDKVSARHILKELEKNGEKEHWPIQDVENDKFPYLDFQSYLKYRGHDNILVDLVPWESSDQGKPKRSSTYMQRMKLEVMLKAPELSALLESKEAHIRLLSGTWGAIQDTKWLVCAGIILSGAGLGLSPVLRDYLALPPAPYYFSLLVGCAIALGMAWSTRTIEKLFHYQRVRELFLIVASLHQAREKERAEKERAEKEGQKRSAPQ